MVIVPTRRHLVTDTERIRRDPVRRAIHSTDRLGWRRRQQLVADDGGGHWKLPPPEIGNVVVVVQPNAGHGHVWDDGGGDGELEGDDGGGGSAKMQQPSLPIDACKKRLLPHRTVAAVVMHIAIMKVRRCLMVLNVWRLPQRQRPLQPRLFAADY